MRRLLAVLLVASAAAAAATGCVVPQGGEPEGVEPAGVASASFVPPMPQEHDHDDPALHPAYGEGVTVLGHHDLVPPGAGDGGRRGDWLNVEVVVREGHAYVGYAGAPWLLGIVDVRDPTSPVMTGALPTTNAWAMDVAVSDDGDWAYVSVYPGAVGTFFSRDYLLQKAEAPAGLPAPGIAIVDCRDRAAPKLSGFMPVHGLGPHTAWYHRYPDGREIVVANKADMPPGNGMLIAEVVKTPTDGRALRPLSFFSLGGPLEMDFPHDVHVAEHPLTGQTIAYVAYWDSGLVLVDITDPARPTLLGRGRTPAGEEAQVHDVHPFPRLVDGRAYTLSAPEIPTGDATGHLRVWDTTDPAAPALVGQWTMPGGYVVDEPFGFSPHNFDFLPDGRVALAHGHAGVWFLSWLGSGGAADPAPTGYHVPAAIARAPAWSPVAGSPWVWGTAVDPVTGATWAIDSAGALWGLEAAPQRASA